jgi:hypothetical protein
MGNSLQRLFALKQILAGMQIPSRIVATTRSEPKGLSAGLGKPGSQIWLKVKFDGEERDVSPERLDNKPGAIHFRPLNKEDKVRSYALPYYYLFQVISKALAAH